MEPAARYVLVPLTVATLLTGLVQSLGIAWGLVRHYWIVFMYLTTFRLMAATAADPNADLDTVRNPSPALHAALALHLLFIATVLAVYKPRGMTGYGYRKQRERRHHHPSGAIPLGG